MHVDLIESLRCPHPHADGWLVARADVVTDRRIVQGSIGCPVCGVEWAIADGALHLSGTTPAREGIERAGPPAELLDIRVEVERAAALLDLRDPNGVVLLAGATARLAEGLAAMTGVLVLAVNPPSGVAHAHARLHVGDAFPLGVGTMRGAYLDAAHEGADWVASASRVVARGGRVIAPVTCALPEALREVARDEREWVAEVRVAASGLVPLRRG